MKRSSVRSDDYDVTAWLLLPIVPAAAYGWYRFSVAHLTPSHVPQGMQLYYPGSCLISAFFAAYTAVTAFAVISVFIERALHIPDDDPRETRQVMVVCLILTAVLGFFTYAQMSVARVVAFGGDEIVVWTVT